MAAGPGPVQAPGEAALPPDSPEAAAAARGLLCPFGAEYTAGWVPAT